MKSSLFFLILLLYAGSLFSGEISKTYYFKDPVITTTGDFQTLWFEGTLITGINSEPALPYQSVMLMLPPGEEAISIELIMGEETLLEGVYRILPQQPSRPVSQGNSGVFSKNEDVYSMDGVYPQESRGKLTTSFLNGLGIGMCTFTPVRYNPAKGSISYFREITVKIKTAPGNKAGQALLNSPRKGWSEARINRLVSNPEMLKTYPVLTERTEGYSLLIVSPQQYESEFETLRDIYQIRGINSEFKALEDINSSISGSDLQEKIRNYIIQEYQANGIEYVLLGGDSELVPYRGFYCQVQSSSIYEDDNIPSDLYYSALDGTWNDDGDNLWGEPGEDDLLPDIAVARLPFSNATDLDKMLHKTISYQENPVLGEMDRPLLAGEHLYSDPLTWGADYLDLLIGEHSDNGYTTVGIPEDDDFLELYDRNATWSAGELISRINEGRSFIHHSGHSNATYTMRLYMSDITNANFSMVNGIDHNYTLVYTHGCICGAFDESDCIAEKMLYIDNFVVAGAFNSRYGWFNEGQTEGPSAHLHREFVDALYNEKIDRIGATHMESKIQTSPWVTAPGQWEEGALRWCFYDCNILGDPALAVWTAEPISVYAAYPTTITVGTPSITINVSSEGIPLENYNCTFFKDDQFHGMATTDNLGNATIVFDPPITSVGDAELIISGYNCLPTIFPTTFIPAGGPYIVYQNHQIDEITGIFNGLPDYGDTGFLEVSMENVGSEDAENVEITIRSTDNHLFLQDSTETYGTIPAGSSLVIPEAFTFTVSDSVPDQYAVTLEVIAGDGSKEIWNSSFEMILLAPELTMGDILVNDATGNANGILDPGETAQIIIATSNTGHSPGENAFGELSTEDDEVTITSPVYNIGHFPFDSTALLSFTVVVDDDVLIGTPVSFSYVCQTGSYSVNQDFEMTIGLIVEDFETGDFSTFDWQPGGHVPWEISTEDPWEGDFCMVSGDIDDSEISLIYVNFDVISDGNISFYRKVSSEEDYDYLRFLIDGVVKGEWAGEHDWEMFTYPVSSGNHTFYWQYAKDIFVSNGDDCAWVDYIVFPPVSPTTGISDETYEQEIHVNAMPNPFKENLKMTVKCAPGSSIQVNLLDIFGRKVMAIYEGKVNPAGIMSFTVGTSGIPGGVYNLQVISGTSVSVKKIVHNQ
ncbi:MAG: hypothetical protein KKA81_12525 [Bacteroidetes bacterium]|nr:hypothetical protein [Bacteroidota bacterium]